MNKRQEDEESWKEEWKSRQDPRFKFRKSGDIDFVSENNCLSGETKYSKNEPPIDTIIQDILEESKAGSSRRWMFAASRHYTHESQCYCFDNKENKINWHGLKASNVTPSDRGDAFKKVKKWLEPIIKAHLMDHLPKFEETEEEERLIKKRQTMTKKGEEFLKELGGGFNKKLLDVDYCVANRTDLDQYYTPPKLVNRAINEVLKFLPDLKAPYDPCCGNGRLIEKFEYSIGSDIDPDCSFSGVYINDFFRNGIIKQAKDCEIIFTNPPFSKKKIGLKENVTTALLKIWEKSNIPYLAFFMDDSLLPHKALPIIGGFLSSTQIDWKNLSCTGGQRPPILFLVLKKGARLSESIILPDVSHNDRPTLLELVPPKDALSIKYPFCEDPRKKYPDWEQWRKDRFLSGVETGKFMRLVKPVTVKEKKFGDSFKLPH
jgi:hypothetical protein